VQTVEVKLWDDLHHRQDREKVPAEVQVELTYRTEKVSKCVRLDLTAAHGDELAKLLAPYLAAGQSPEAEDSAREVKSGGKIRRGPPGGPGGSAARKWRENLRAWSDGLGLVNRDDPGYPAWQTTSGKHYYPADLEDAFILHKDGHEEEALALVAKFKPQAA
jgi:hypothetical protein